MQIVHTAKSGIVSNFVHTLLSFLFFLSFSFSFFFFFLVFLSSWVPVGFITAEPQWELPIFFFNTATPAAYGGFQGRRLFGAAAASLCHSYSHAISKPHLQPMSQLATVPDP